MKTKPAMKVRRFQASETATLLSWIDGELNRKIWSGNTFPEEFGEEIFLRHLTRENLFAFSGFHPTEEFVAYGELVGEKNDAGILCRVIVNPAERGQGLGKTFCTELLRIAFEDFHYRHITLNAFHFNVPAIRCYKALGFREVAFRPKARNYKDQKWDLVILRKDRPLAT